MIVTHDVDLAIAAIQAGHVVAIPTETVYGLAADATNNEAVRKIYAIKGRPLDHPLIVHIASTDDLSKFAERIPDNATTLCHSFWPGPLTVVLQRRPGICDAAAAGLETIALRCPAHPVTMELIERGGVSLAAPSANRFGKVSPTTAEHVVNDLGEEVDLVLDGGPCSIGVESTIVDFTVSPPVILRPGAISKDEIESLIGPVGTSSATKSPGTLPSHYAPHCRVLLAESRTEAETLKQKVQGDGIHVRVVDYGADVVGFAHGLYTDLRRCDDDKIDTAIFVLPPDTGVGSAVRDRLRRAANY